MNSQELDEAYRKVRIARQSSKNFHNAWCAIMDAFADFIDADLNADRAAEISDKYARRIVNNQPSDEQSK